MRRILAVAVAALGALLASFIMAEYEFEGTTPFLAGLAVGVLVGEVLSALGRWHGRVAMSVAAVLAAASILYGQWLESEALVEPWSHLAWWGAGLAALLAAWSVRPRPTRPAATPDGGPDAGS